MNSIVLAVTLSWIVGSEAPLPDPAYPEGTLRQLKVEGTFPSMYDCMDTLQTHMQKAKFLSGHGGVSLAGRACELEAAAAPASAPSKSVKKAASSAAAAAKATVERSTTAAPK